MCGIFGCVLMEGDGQVAPLIHAALKRLEYRGYDSVGEATVHQGCLFMKKDKGPIDQVHAALDLDDLEGRLGIGHTRWATHGAPEQVNAHPHLDCHGTIAVVHNGIIENFQPLKRELEDLGHRFLSRTDTEVVPHLIEEQMRRGLDFVESVRAAVEQLEGAYAIAVVSAGAPDTLVLARQGSPLVVGVAADVLCASSDIPTLLPLTHRILEVQNGELVVLSDGGVVIQRIGDGSRVEREPVPITWSVEVAQKQGYPHFMLKEIHEQAQCLENARRLRADYLDLLTTFLDRSKQTYLLACGTSYNACLAASYMFANLCNLSTIPVIASEFIERHGDATNIDSTLLAVSQSGETADVLHAIDHARFQAATILGLTNTMGSTLTRVTRAYISQQSGPEIGVAATKTFTAQLMVLAQLALRLAKVRGKVSQEHMDYLEARLDEMPELVERVVRQQEAKVKTVVAKYAAAECVHFLARGISTATAQEGMLKLLEIAYIPCLADPAGESVYGHVTPIQDGQPVIFICPPDDTRMILRRDIRAMQARGARVIAVVEETDRGTQQLVDDYFTIPAGVPPILSPIPYVVPLQLFAYYMAVERGVDPDKPRNLAKSVTVL
jgi:glucosamine--fructose-6-phosphate aminotransferase (isomerizing)